MEKKITKTQRNKIVRKILNTYNKKWAGLSNLLYSGEINFNDTFNKSYNEHSDSDVTFIVDSAAGCLCDVDLTAKEDELFTLLELAN